MRPLVFLGPAMGAVAVLGAGGSEPLGRAPFQA